MRAWIKDAMSRIGAKLVDEERRQIVAAIGGVKGSWYKHTVGLHALTLV